MPECASILLMEITKSDELPFSYLSLLLRPQLVDGYTPNLCANETLVSADASVKACVESRCLVGPGLEM